MRAGLHRLSLCTLIGFATLAGTLMPAGARPAAVPPAPGGRGITLLGSGTWDVQPEIAAWAKVMAAGASPVQLSYTAAGGYNARQDFARGSTDFVVSGSGFTASEQALLARSGRGYIAIPLQPSAVAFLLHGPAGGMTYQVTATGGAASTIPLASPVRMPDQVMAEAVLGGGPNPWEDPSFLSANNIPTAGHPSLTRNVQAVDATPGESILQLERYLLAANPALWAKRLADNGVPNGGESEFWPVVKDFVTTSGTDALLAWLAKGVSAGGQVVPVPLWAVSVALGRLPNDDLRTIQLHNTAGAWVAPTAQSVAAAVDARTHPGDPTPAGAYPLSWVDSLYGPTSGLSPDRTNALASLIRYAVTAGRADSASHGDAPLPGSLVTQALAGANQLVLDNCPGSGHGSEGGFFICNPLSAGEAQVPEGVASPTPDPPTGPALATAPAPLSAGVPAPAPAGPVPGAVPEGQGAAVQAAADPLPAVAAADLAATGTGADGRATPGGSLTAVGNPTAAPRGFTALGPLVVGVDDTASAHAPAPVQAPPVAAEQAAGMPGAAPAHGLILSGAASPDGHAARVLVAVALCLLAYTLWAARPRRAPGGAPGRGTPAWVRPLSAPARGAHAWRRANPRAGSGIAGHGARGGPSR